MRLMPFFIVFVLMCGCIGDTTLDASKTTATKPTQKTTTTLGETQTTIETTPPTSEEECAMLVEEINVMLGEAKQCRVDEDCVVLEVSLGCPFGCHNLINKNVDLGGIKKSAEEYHRKCAPCEYICARPPKPEEIRCRNNKCVQETFAIKAQP